MSICVNCCLMSSSWKSSSNLSSNTLQEIVTIFQHRQSVQVVQKLDEPRVAHQLSIHSHRPALRVKLRYLDDWTAAYATYSSYASLR